MMICLFFPNTQQDHVPIAQLSQGTVHCPELDDTFLIMLDNALKQWSELHQVQHAHLPELFAQVRTDDDAQWLKTNRACQEECLEESVIDLRSQGICIDFCSLTSGAHLFFAIAKHGFKELLEKCFKIVLS